MIRNIFFDMDGTLFDTSEGILNSMIYALKKENIKGIDEEVIKSTIGMSLDNMIKIILNDPKEEILIRVRDAFRKYYTEKGVYELKPYNNTLDILKQLKDMGYRLFIMTLKPTFFAEKIVEKFGIKDLFLEISGIELKGPVESKKERMKKILEKYSLKVRESAMVGDSKEDIKSAKEIGMYSIAVTYGFGKLKDLKEAQADFYIDDLKEIFDILETVN